MARKPFLTSEEAAALVAEHGSTRKAAKASGHSQTCIAKWLRRAAPRLVLGAQSRLMKGDLEAARWDKYRSGGRPIEETNDGPPDPLIVKRRASYYNAEGEVTGQWITEEQGAREKLGAWQEVAERLSRTVARVEPLPAPASVNSQLLAGYPVADHHMGMLSWAPESGADYDLQIGERLLTGAMSYLTQATGGAEHALVAFMGDFMHYDSHESVTPASKHQLDSDSRYSKIADGAVRLMRTSVDLALRAHRHVHVIVIPGNHDPASSVFLALCMRVAYEREPRVTVDASPSHYRYHRFGSVLLGTYHGHGAKMQQLPMIMAADRPEDWGSTRHRHWWTGHIHHSRTQAATSAQDYSGCTVESFRILPPPDAYHANAGYRALRDMKAIVYHRDHGEVARHTVNPSMLELT